MNEIECPYCEEDNEVCHDDGFGYEEGEAHEMECDKCGKKFVFYTEIHFHYSPQKADCLNGSPHQFGEWQMIWTVENGDEVQRRGCKDCDHSERRTVPKTDGGEA